MTTYTALTAGEYDQDSPITQPLATAWTGNVLAIQEGDTSAPILYNAWQIEDGSGGTDPIWSFASDGSVATVTSPDFEDGFEYAFHLTGVSLDTTTNIRIRFWKETDASYQNLASDSGSVGATGSTIDGIFIVRFPRVAKRIHQIDWFAPLEEAGATPLTPATNTMADTTRQTILRVQITATGGANFDAGQIYMWKRGESVTR